MEFIDGTVLQHLEADDLEDLGLAPAVAEQLAKFVAAAVLEEEEEDGTARQEART